MQTQTSVGPRSFIPSSYQVPLNPADFIIEHPEPAGEAVEFDVLFVGAGSSGLCGAIELKRLAQTDPQLSGIEVGVIDKAEGLGHHNLSGAVINPRELFEMFPELNPSDFPFRGKVAGERVYFVTEKSHFRIPTPPTMRNHGNYHASICEVLRWLGTKAEDLGVTILPSFPAAALIEENGRIVGVRTTPMGLSRDGSPGEQHMPATDIRAKLVVLCEGTRGPLTQSYLQKNNITSPRPQIYSLGVKELWRTPNPPQHVIHTLGWPLRAQNAFGGSWIYPMGDGLVSIGLVASLDYAGHKLDVHQELQRLKQHPLFQQYLRGGELVEWGAKTIPEGGALAIASQLHGHGIMICGDAAGLVNVPALKGVHNAMHSGRLAARTALKALKQQDFTASTLADYTQNLRASYVFKDLFKVRNMRHAFKHGFVWGGIRSALMILTGGIWPGVKEALCQQEDANEPKYVTVVTEDHKPHGALSKVDAVYQSGNVTRDDIPPHLTPKTQIPREVAEFYQALCPAGVYELTSSGELKINAPNCVDCKATDVLGPRWQPREGGSGPKYQQM